MAPMPVYASVSFARTPLSEISGKVEELDGARTTNAVAIPGPPSS
jgi:hypothetical protein